MESLDDIRWRAVRDRDASLEGVFVFAVSSTGVACRPGCSSRTPRRENVAFFANLDEAQGAGYRACQRCRPERETLRDASLEAVVTLCRRLENDDATIVADVAADVGYSERHLRRRFAEVLGVTVATYARALRAQRARAALTSSSAVTSALYESGFGSSRAFYEHGATRLGMTPSTYRSGAQGIDIAFTTLHTPLGVVIVGCTQRGVCAVRIGDDESALEDELSREFPQARLHRDDEGMIEVATMVARAVRGEGEATSLPIDVQGTAFQVRVWEALREVPRGTTLSYSELADRVGSPRAVRAVGSACGANPVALVVPCHRIVRRDGSLGGYRWGLDVKRALLHAESADGSS